MHRLALICLLSLPLLACQASVKEEFAEMPVQTTTVAALPTTEPQSFAPVGPYNGTADVKALTDKFWTVDEGDSAPFRECKLVFSRLTGVQAQTANVGQPTGSVSPNGCMSTDISKVSRWLVNGDTIELHGDGESAVAYLLMERPDLLLGYTAKGKDLVISQ